jgi:Tol biopolymer transport system component
MMRRIATVLAVAALVPGGVAFAATAETSLVSVTVDGTPAAGTSGRPSISADGRFVAFASTAPNLVRGDNNGVPDVFVRDRRTGVTTRVSVSSTGAEANGPSGNPSISGDGRYVVFESRATNLITDNPGKFQNIYDHDLVSGKTQRVNYSGSLSWLQPDGDSANPVISADGQHIAFDSVATNIGVFDNNGASDVFEWERAWPTLQHLVSHNRRNEVADGASWGPSISADGNQIAFTSDADDLDLRADNNQASDVFVSDFGQVLMESRGFDGKQGNNTSRNPVISADGKHIVFESYASNLVPNDTNGRPDLFTARTGYWETITRVNADPAGAVAGGNIGPRSAISADGRYVAFSSGEDGLAANDTNGTWDVLLRDTVAGTTSLVSATSGGTPGDNFSEEPSISTDGGHVAFKSQATNFVPGVPLPSANAYVRDLG